jgi:hypothetical protein
VPPQRRKAALNLSTSTANPIADIPRTGVIHIHKGSDAALTLVIVPPAAGFLEIKTSV